MEFAAVVGNPPYQQQDKGEGSGASPIYPYFIDFSQVLSRLAILIHPARFLFNAGKTSKQWNHKILQNPNFAVEKYWANSSSVFTDVDIKGGVAVTTWNQDVEIGPIGQFIPDPTLKSIVSKVNSIRRESFSTLVYPRDLYRLSEAVYNEHPEFHGKQAKGHDYDLGSNIFNRMTALFSESPSTEYNSVVYGRSNSIRIVKYISQRYLKTPDNFMYYKILLPKSNGTGKLGEILSSPFVAQPKSAHTVTFLSIGKFDSIEEANAALKFLKTRFARILLGSLKVTQDNPRPVWENVPLEDFSTTSDIDWSKSISEIEEQLFDKYKLLPAERKFITDTAEPMR